MIVSFADLGLANIMDTWSEKFNALPPEIRHIGSMCETELRIQHLNFEKDRLKKRYQQSCKEINEHIKTCKELLKRGA